MVQIPRIATATADNTIAPAVARNTERPTVLAGLPPGADAVDRNRNNVVRASDTRPGSSPSAPDASQPGLVKRGLGIVGGYTAGNIVGAGVAVALGAGLGPILLLGVLAGVAAAKATDNYVTTGRFW